MDSFLLKFLLPYCIGWVAFWHIAQRLYCAAEYYWRAMGDKRAMAHDEMVAARYRSLGVNCHGHCYLFGCKYERIEEELLTLGIHKADITRLVESLNGVPHRKPCDCGKALLPSLTPENAPCEPVVPSSSSESSASGPSALPPPSDTTPS
ncbi:MAG: hypothetical protein U0800_12525 [Isosphaeraceae bacterium]